MRTERPEGKGQRAKFGVAMTVVASMLVACGGGAPSSASSSISAPPASGGTLTQPSPAAADEGSSARASASAQASAAAPAASGQVNWKAGTQHVATDAPLYIAQEKGFFKAQGVNVEFTDINNQEAIPAVSTGQLDSSVGAIYSSLFNAVARGVEIRAVATKGSITDTPQDKPSSGLVIRKQLFDSGAIKEAKDLKGRKIVVASRGATQEESLDNFMKEAGLSIDDIDVQTMNFPDTLPALANGSIDGAMELQPWITQGRANNILVFWKDTAEMTPGLQTNALTFGPSVPKMGQNAGTRFMTAFTQGLRYYNDAVGPKHANWDEFVNIMIKNTSLKDKALYDQVGWTYMSPNCSLNIPSVGQNQDWYAAHGYVPKTVDVTTVVDDSYCQAAVKGLGAYK